MKINDIKDLEKVVKLCRRLGIDALEVDNIKFNLGLAPKRQRLQSNPANDFPEANIKIPLYTPVSAGGANSAAMGEVSSSSTINIEELTEEQLLNWSVTDDSVEQTATVKG